MQKGPLIDITQATQHGLDHSPVIKCLHTEVHPNDEAWKPPSINEGEERVIYQSSCIGFTHSDFVVVPPQIECDAGHRSQVRANDPVELEASDADEERNEKCEEQDLLRERLVR